jgi:hypothetical protein
MPTRAELAALTGGQFEELRTAVAREDRRRAAEFMVSTTHELMNGADVRVLIPAGVNLDLAVTLLKKITATIEPGKPVPAKPDVGTDTRDDLPS